MIAELLFEEVSFPSDGDSASGKIVEISLPFPEREGGVSLLQAVKDISGIKDAVKAASHNNFLFFILFTPKICRCAVTVLRLAERIKNA